MSTNGQEVVQGVKESQSMIVRTEASSRVLIRDTRRNVEVSKSGVVGWKGGCVSGIRPGLSSFVFGESGSHVQPQNKL